MTRRVRACLLAAGMLLAVSGCAGDQATSKIPVTQLMAGQCFDLDAERTTAFVHRDCSVPHTYEAISVEQLDGASYPGDAPFPGDDVLAREASALCTAAMQERPATDPARAEQAALFLAPSEESWRDEGDRRIVCVLTSSDELHEGEEEEG